MENIIQKITQLKWRKKPKNEVTKICNESVSKFGIGCWAFLLKKWLLFVKNHSPVIIAINSSKSTVPDPSSSTSSMICSRLQSSSDVSISRKISFNTSTVIYPFPVTQKKSNSNFPPNIFEKCRFHVKFSSILQQLYIRFL